VLVGAASKRSRRAYWAHLTKRKIKHCKGSVILVNDERSVTLSDKAERPEKKRQSAPGFAVKRAVIKSWRVFFWSNQPQKALTCFIIRFVSGPQLADVAGLSPRQFGRVFLSETGQTPAKAVETLRAESARANREDQ
jgi:AraC-like DNA-binding protein